MDFELPCPHCGSLVAAPRLKQHISAEHPDGGQAAAAAAAAGSSERPGPQKPPPPPPGQQPKLNLPRKQVAAFAAFKEAVTVGRQWRAACGGVHSFVGLSVRQPCCSSHDFGSCGRGEPATSGCVCMSGSSACCLLLLCSRRPTQLTLGPHNPWPTPPSHFSFPAIRVAVGCQQKRDSGAQGEHAGRQPRATQQGGSSSGGKGRQAVARGE